MPDKYSTKLDQVSEDVKLIKTALLGDPSDVGKPGMIVRLDRVEQKIKFRDKLLYVFMSAVITLVVTKLIGV